MAPSRSLVLPSTEAHKPVSHQTQSGKIKELTDRVECCEKVLTYDAVILRHSCVPLYSPADSKCVPGPLS